MPKTIDIFRGEYFFLSNFYMADVEFEGEIYPSVEHAFQAAKTLDSKERAKIRGTILASEAKKIGRKVKLRPDWEEIKFEVMLQLVYNKFARHKYLAERLVRTGDAILIEGNHWGDVTWGVCKGVGKNWLGQILMQVRDDLVDIEGKDKS